MQHGVNKRQDGFAVIDVKCPSCGAPLQMREDATTLVCDFCGSTLHVNRPAPVDTGIDADGTIRDRGTGYGLFRGVIPQGWSVSGTALERTGSLSRPYLPQVALVHTGGALVSILQGEAGTRRSAGMNAIDAMYGQAAAPYDTSNYAEMPDPVGVADTQVSTQVRAMGGADLRLIGQVGSTSPEDAQRRAADHYASEARLAGLVVNEFLGAQVIRTYAFTLGGAPWKAAVFVEAWGAKGGLGGIGAGIGGIAEVFGGLFGGSNQQGGAPAQNEASQQAPSAGSMLKGALDFTMGGGLIGKKMKEARNQQAAQPYGAHQSALQKQPYSSQQGQLSNVLPSSVQGAPQSTGWCIPDFSVFNQGGTVYWSYDRIMSLVAPDNQFVALLQGDFAAMVQSVFVHSDVKSLGRADAQQTNAAIQANTQTALAQSNARFQAQQAAHRQQQAAFNSYNDSISAARDSRQASFRSATNAQFSGGSAVGGGHADFSEAIRGVNTYVTTDGREVELSVHSDVAYENQAGDVIGGSSGFDPGADWTQISRK